MKAIKYSTSDGERITQATIDRRRSEIYRKEGIYSESNICEGCEKERATEHSHIISQGMCKILGKAELCYKSVNWFLSCRKCHQDWENKKSGKFGNLKNIDLLLAVLRRFDPDEYRKRLIILDEL